MTETSGSHLRAFLNTTAVQSHGQLYIYEDNEHYVHKKHVSGAVFWIKIIFRLRTKMVREGLFLEVESF